MASNGSTVRFNVQTFLRDMRQELNDKIDAGFARTDTIATELRTHAAADELAITELRTRLQPVEQLGKSLKWFMRTTLGAVLYIVIDLAINHLPKFWK